MNDLPTPDSSNWKQQTYLVGGIAGLVFGVLSAYFFTRVSDEYELEDRPHISTMDALKLAVALLAIIRQITDLGVKSAND